MRADLCELKDHSATKNTKIHQVGIAVLKGAGTPAVRIAAVPATLQHNQIVVHHFAFSCVFRGKELFRNH